MLEASSIYYGLTLLDLRKLAFEFADANRIPMPQSWENNKVAGEEWLVNFRERHEKELSLRKPEATSLNRMQGFNKTNVTEFFVNLQHVMDEKKFTPDRIWNIDETGCSTVQTPQRQLARKGEKRVGSVVSQEKGTTVTMCGSINAIGNSMPPFLVFPRKNIQDHWTLTAPIGTVCDSHPNASGWMTTDNFLRFLDHFKNHAKPSAESPVLLILDNHASHVNSEVIQYCKMNNITLLSFPPHCSHEMQPLDKSVYGPFQTFYDQSVDRWCKDPLNAGKQMSIHTIPLMVSYAFPKAFTPQNIIAGFRSTGICPLDPNVFPDHKFSPTYSTDHPLIAQEQATSSKGSEQDTNPSATPSYPILLSPTDKPTSSKEPEQESSPSSNATSPILLSPKDIRPLARVGVRKEGIRKRKAVKSTILTLTPEKRPVLATRKNQLKTQAPRKLVYSSDSDSEANEALDRHLETTDNDEMEDILTENEEDELTVLSSTLGEAEIKALQPGDFIFFRCEGKKSAVFYTGLIKESVDPEGDFEVEFLKRSDKVRNKFINFNQEEIWSVNQAQIIKKLTKAESSGTARTKTGHIFNEDIVNLAT